MKFGIDENIKKYFELTEEDLDPEIAALLEDFDDGPAESEPEPVLEPEPAIQKQKTVVSDEPVQEVELPETSEYMNAILDDEDKRMIDTLLKAKTLFENPPDKSERFFYREKLTAAYWNFYRLLSKRLTQPDISTEKKMCLRYNLFDASWINDDQMGMLKRVPFDKDPDESIYYVDQWLSAVAREEIKGSVMDETQVVRQSGRQVLEERLEKRKGQFEAEQMSAEAKVEEMKAEERDLVEMVEQLTRHEPYPHIEGHDLIEAYDDFQKTLPSSIQECVRKLQRIDKELKLTYSRLESHMEDIREIEANIGDSDPDSGIDHEALSNEIDVVRQMIKICVGRQGNHFPILLDQYFSADPNQMATVDNIRQILSEVEYLDPSVFVRTYRGEENRIEPYLIIVPCYGELGMCWEPFSRFNRATSKGRIAIPLLPKNLKMAVIYAVADLRWQIAKEKAQHHWMEEGLTGKYYEYYSENKLKGDIKRYFVSDYYKWITMESEGMQKIDKNVRTFFWRLMPFPKEVKEKLKNAGFFYQELYKRDQNISKSDGY